MTLDDIVLELLPSAEPVMLRGGLAPTPEVMSQLSGAEWLWNLPGTAEDKTTFVKACGIGCHSYELIFRNRYDERSWRLIVERMKTGAQGGPGRAMDPDSEAGSVANGEIDAIAKWLATVRGPDSKDAPVRMWSSRPSGAATRVVITEYEVESSVSEPPRRLRGCEGQHLVQQLARPTGGVPGSAHWDHQGVQTAPRGRGGPVVGSHACRVDDKRGYVWVSQGPSQPGRSALFRLTMATGEIKQFPPVAGGEFRDRARWVPLVRPSQAQDGKQETVRIDPETGQVVQAYSAADDAASISACRVGRRAVCRRRRRRGPRLQLRLDPRREDRQSV